MFLYTLNCINDKILPNQISDDAASHGDDDEFGAEVFNTLITMI